MRRTLLEEAFRHDRAALLATLVLVPLACWAWIVPMARDMYGAMTGPSAWMMTSVWDAPHVTLLLAMWTVMMAGMMLPSAAPVLLLFAGAVRHRAGERAAARAVYGMTAGYLTVWTAFSLCATALQLGLRSALLLSPMMTLTSSRFAGGVLIVAGIYQLTPLKSQCLSWCGAPIDFLTRRWRGERTAFRVGLEHGVLCVGCCWALMLLLFVGGVMNIAMIALLTTLVLVEKLARLGRRSVRVTGVLLIVIGVGFIVTARISAREPARNVVIVTIDGLRWQEVFTGAAEAYFTRNAHGQLPAGAKDYLAATAEQRRALLMPFVWTVMAKQGQIVGDPSKRSLAHVTNGLWFSYPGYSEMFAGIADPRVDSNDKVPNPNVTVLEWLNGRRGFEGRVAAFGAWDVFPFIFNTERSRLPVGAGYQPVPHPSTERQRAINQLAGDLPRYWDDEVFDAPVLYAALDALQTRRPRVLTVMLGEGDDWAHEGRYDLYLDATRRADRCIERLWQTLQELPQYRGNTTLLVTTDHGRGATTRDWSDHGRDVPAAEATWIAALGPTIPALGNREALTVTTAQIAATIAQLVGENFRSSMPQAAPPIMWTR